MPFSIARTMLVLLFFAPGNAPPGSLRGIVRDSSGAVLPGAAILIQHWNLDGGHPRSATDESLIYADNKGGFTAQLQPGVYDILVTYPGFAPAAKEVGVKSSKETSLEFELSFSAFTKFVQ